MSFIFADLIILPILDIYRKYYGWKVMSYILVTFYVTMAAAGYVVELLFGALGIIPQNRNVAAITEGMQWNYTTVLNLFFLVIAAVLVIRFLRTGGPAMLKMMSKPAHAIEHHGMHADAGHTHESEDHEMGHHDMHHHEMHTREQSHEQKGMEA